MARFLTCAQGSPEWLIERSKRITGTDAAAILGISPWKTPLQLFNEKMGLSSQKVNKAMAFGSSMEPYIREYYECKTGEWFPAAVVVSDNDIFMASLDGINANHTKILEIKTCNKETFEKARFGSIPDYYISQGQHAMMCVPKAQCVDFVFYNSGNFIFVTLDRDEAYIERLFSEELYFYENYLKQRTEPPPSEKDSIDLSGNEEWMALAKKAKEVHARYAACKEEWDSMRLQLIDLSDDGNCHGGGISISKTWKKGPIDTEKMLSDGIDSDIYRKSPVSSITVRVATDN